MNTKKGTVPPKVNKKVISQEERWATAYRKLLEYKKEYGNIDIPSNYVTADGYKLGAWLYHQKKVLSESESKDSLFSNISTVHYTLLKNAGVEAREAKKDWFDVFYSHAKEFAENNGHLKVPCKYVCKDGYLLGRRLFDLRRFYLSLLKVPGYENINRCKTYQKMKIKLDLIKKLNSLDPLWIGKKSQKMIEEIKADFNDNELDELIRQTDTAIGINESGSAAGVYTGDVLEIESNGFKIVLPNKTIRHTDAASLVCTAASHLTARAV